MKIECDKCGAKYSIADEKVRGKTFKIRCKKCSNVIIVRDKAAAAADVPGGGDDSEPEEPAPAHPGWHLAINGETVGPLSEAEVRQRFAAGEVDRDTAIWQEGFEDWVAIADVDVFSDLQASPSGGGGGAAEADDPFASANQDDYAASSAGAGDLAAGAAAGFAAAGAAAAAAEPHPQSPRVSSLTGQRNENSVLFSLDSLQALATGGGGGGGAAAPTSGSAAPAAAAAKPVSSPRGLATSAPSSEGSGLIDIRALGAMVQDDERGGAAPAAAPSGKRSGEDAAIPSFGGAGLGGLASTPLVPQAQPVEPGAMAAPPPAKSNMTALYVLMALLIVAVFGLTYVALFREPETRIVQSTVPAAPSVKAADDEEDEEKDEKKKDEDEEVQDDAAKDEEAAAADEGEEDKEASGDSKSSKASKSRSRRRSKSRSKSRSRDRDAAPTPSSSPSPKPAAKKDDGGGVDVDCILDPSKCGGSKKSSSKKPAASSDPNLPDKLSSSDIKAGIAPVKNAAKACGSKHGAKPGESVRVRISISGSSGTVSSATAQGEHKGTPLGNCVAAALKQAKFKKFKSSSMGAIYPMRM